MFDHFITFSTQTPHECRLNVVTNTYVCHVPKLKNRIYKCSSKRNGQKLNFFYNVEYYIFLGSRHVPRVEHKLLTRTEQLSSPPIFMRFVLVDLWFSVWCIFFIVVYPFARFLLAFWDLRLFIQRMPNDHVLNRSRIELVVLI